MKCTGKERDHCREEKMGCIGCYYDEIEAGEYIRTESGHIFKVDEEKKVLNGIKFLNVQYGRIVDHNKMIERLIRKGDVLQYKVNTQCIEIDEVKEFLNPKTNSRFLGVAGWGLDQIDILKIISREEFKKIGYLV